MSERKRQRDGAGYGPDTWKKHEVIRQMIGGQISVLRRTKGKSGVIIDMHAGDGNGVEIANGQLDMWRPNVSDATPALALRFAQEEWPWAKVILCESNFRKRERLKALYGENADILSTNRGLLKVTYDKFSWAIVLNDPNGPADHAIDVMCHISSSMEISDFIVVVNVGALGRLAGVRHVGDDLGENSHMVKGCREKAASYAWMNDTDRWKSVLGKRYAATARATINNKAMKGRIVLLTNYICEGLRNHGYIRGDER